MMRSCREKEFENLRPTILLFLMLPLLGGCFGQENTVVEYRLRCVDETSESLRDCEDWATDDRVFYELDLGNRSVTRRIEDGAPGRYESCTIYNPDHWACNAEIGLPAIEFKQGRRIQGDADQLSMQLGKRVTWFEWWSTRIMEMVFG